MGPELREIYLKMFSKYMAVREQRRGRNCSPKIFVLICGAKARAIGCDDQWSRLKFAHAYIFGYSIQMEGL